MIKVVDFKHPKFSDEKEWQGDFYFIQGADSQFGMISTFRDNLSEPDWEEEMELTRLCVKKINAMRPKPKFFVVCGDLTDAMPDNNDLLEYKKKQEADFIKIFNNLDKDIPLVCVCGNHDVGNQPTVTTVNRYRSVFGNDYFSFWCGGVLFLVLNSQYYFDGSKIPELVQEQENWLDARLKEANSSKHSAVIFQHIPHFIKTAAETDSGYFALPLTAREPILNKLYSAGVRYIFCGHYHRNAGGFYKDMELVVTSAIGHQLGSDKSGVRIVKVTDKKISHCYYAFENLPSNLQ